MEHSPLSKPGEKTKKVKMVSFNTKGEKEIKKKLGIHINNLKSNSAIINLPSGDSQFFFNGKYM